MKTIYLAATPLLVTFLLLNSASLPQTALAPAQGTNAQGVTATKGWSWPLTPQPKVLRAFDPPAQRWLAGHRGADLGAHPGDVVLAPAAGIVTYVGVIVDRPVLVIDHGAGLKSSFEPVSTDLVPGSIISAKERIGSIGVGAHCTKRCMHWGLRLNGEYIDPLLTIRDARPSILLPLGNKGG
ncbi:peptidase M23 [Arthrobacter sp. MYb227]|uniref:M23 family metallopeptidase n=1 Tax=Arthrobacter sp. MYb227 TaxID=1848601 RepID=UPI000CFD845B|nr:M23 family metallopeptidase [Arthrobacter sp. MYb227]PQZ92975.1 peptidase M23 [Arthrobacter sp. MYb227]